MHQAVIAESCPPGGRPALAVHLHGLGFRLPVADQRYAAQHIDGRLQVPRHVDADQRGNQQHAVIEGRYAKASVQRDGPAEGITHGHAEAGGRQGHDVVHARGQRAIAVAPVGTGGHVLKLFPAVGQPFEPVPGQHGHQHVEAEGREHGPQLKKLLGTGRKAVERHHRAHPCHARGRLVAPRLAAELQGLAVRFFDVDGPRGVQGRGRALGRGGGAEDQQGQRCGEAEKGALGGHCAQDYAGRAVAATVSSLLLRSNMLREVFRARGTRGSLIDHAPGNAACGNGDARYRLIERPAGCARRHFW